MTIDHTFVFEPQGQQAASGSAQRVPKSSPEPIPVADKALWDEIMRADRSFCGGKLVRCINESNYPVIVYAVPELTPADIQETLGFFSGTNRLLGDHFLRCFKTIPCGKFTCFHFEVPDGMQTVREILRSGRKLDYMVVFHELLDIIEAFHASRTNPNTALSCISPDTVLVDKAGTKAMVLPLVNPVGHVGSYPRELPREAGTESECLQTDLYSAAMLAVEICNGTATLKGLQMPRCEILARCLQPLPDWRPKTVRQVREALPQVAHGFQRHSQPPQRSERNPQRSPNGSQAQNTAAKSISGAWDRLRELFNRLVSLEEPETSEELDATQR